MALNKSPAISTIEKRRAEEAKPKDPAVSPQRNYFLTWSEYVNDFFCIYLKKYSSIF